MSGVVVAVVIVIVACRFCGVVVAVGPCGSLRRAIEGEKVDVIADIEGGNTGCLDCVVDSGRELGNIEYEVGFTNAATSSGRALRRGHRRPAECQ